MPSILKSAKRCPSRVSTRNCGRHRDVEVCHHVGQARLARGLVTAVAAVEGRGRAPQATVPGEELDGRAQIVARQERGVERGVGGDRCIHGARHESGLHDGDRDRHHETESGHRGIDEAGHARVAHDVGSSAGDLVADASHVDCTSSARHTGSPAASTRDSWLSAARPPRWRSTALARSRCRSASSVGARVAYQPVAELVQQTRAHQPPHLVRVDASGRELRCAEDVVGGIRESPSWCGHLPMVARGGDPGWRRTRASVDGAGRASGGVDPATLAGLGDAGGSEPPAPRWLRTIRVARDRHGAARVASGVRMGRRRSRRRCRRSRSCG